MRQHRFCTKCGHTSLWVIDKVCYALDGDGFNTKALSITNLAYPGTGTLPKMVGKFEALICANTACGYTEWHAYDLEGLTELAKDPKSGVRLISSESSSPYR